MIRIINSVQTRNLSILKEK